jgi:hypothetical protein
LVGNQSSSTRLPNRGADSPDFLLKLHEAHRRHPDRRYPNRFRGRQIACRHNVETPLRRITVVRLFPNDIIAREDIDISVATGLRRPYRPIRTLNEEALARGDVVERFAGLAGGRRPRLLGR